MKHWFFMLITLLILQGCSTFSSALPERDPDPTTVTISLYASSYVNPNIDGEASPIEIQLFELEDDSMLLSADYDQINADYKEALKSNFIKNYDFVLTPDQYKYVNTFKIDSSTNYIGVVAHFSDPEKSEWKKTIKVVNEDKQYHIFVYLKYFDVELKKVE